MRRIIDPGALELVEQKLVGVGQLESEPLVENLDNLREPLCLRLMLRASPVEDRAHLALAVVERHRSHATLAFVLQAVV